MNESVNFADIMTAWAANEPSVKALVLIGSRVRPASDSVWCADAYSDWDFQVITSRPQMFLNDDWTRRLSGMQLQAYAARIARIGGVPKINSIFCGVEADFVVLNARSFRFLKTLVALGAHRRMPSLHRKLQDLAIVVRPGWRFLKGAKAWEVFYQRVVTEISDPRLSDEDACRVADGFACDYISILRKIARGELLAAKRLLHRDLAEINFRLLHELRLRHGQKTFPEARRIERVATQQELMAIIVDDRLEEAALRAAVEKYARTCRTLMQDLVGPAWSWPAL